MKADSDISKTGGDYLSELRTRAEEFARELARRREELAPRDFWYPYGSMANFQILDRFLTGENRNLLRDVTSKRAADIGAADGDVSFFLEREGWAMTIIDNPPTNWNGVRGARLTKEALESKVEITELDLDAQFDLSESFDVVFFLGILYHLKNPFYILEKLSRHARHAFISTRIMRWSAPAELPDTPHNSASERRFLADLPLAYLLGPTECNNDSTNYWIFSEAGLRRILDRAGWDIADYMILGAVDTADPFTTENDARAFALIKSRNF